MANYTIQPGDTLAKIAAAYGTTVAALTSANGISNPNSIKSGSSINIPGSGNSQTSGALTPTMGPGGNSAPAAGPTIQNGALVANIGPGSIPSSSGSAGSYTIQPGDTLASIAARTGTTVAALASANGISNPNVIQSGKTLSLPSGATAPTTSRTASSLGLGTGNGTQPVTTGTPVSPVATGTSTGGATIPGTNYPSTGNPDLDKIVTATVGTGGVLDQQTAAGNVINPGLDITPDLVSQFLSEAHTQVDPEYQQAFANEISNVNSSLQDLSTNFQNNQDQSISDFTQNLNTERNAAGGAGIAFSGTRGLAENYMLNGENRSLSSLSADYANNVGNTLRAGATAVGGNNFGLSPGTSGFNVPTVGTETATLAGARGGSVANGPVSYNYDPSTYSGFGTISANYGSDLTKEANTNLSNYQSSAANTPSRSFSNLSGTPTLQ